MGCDPSVAQMPCNMHVYRREKTALICVVDCIGYIVACSFTKLRDSQLRPLFEFGFLMSLMLYTILRTCATWFLILIV